MYSTSYDDTFLIFANFQAIFVELGLPLLLPLLTRRVMSADAGGGSAGSGLSLFSGKSDHGFKVRSAGKHVDEHSLFHLIVVKSVNIPGKRRGIA